MSPHGEQRSDARKGFADRFPRVTAVFGLDTRSLAAFRVALGTVLLCDLAVRATDLRAHYTDDGVLPRTAVLERFWDPWYFSVHFLGGNAFYAGFLLALAAFFALCLAFGVRTRAATVASWFLAVSLQNRNPLILSGADVLVRLLLFWSMFLPLGDRFSIDALLRGRKEPVSNVRISGATFALTLQVMCVYVFAGLIKLDIHEWQNGSAIAHALRAPEFGTRLGLFVARDPDAIAKLGRAVPYQELLLPFLLLAPVYTAFFRTAALLAFFAFHASIGLCMDIGIFVPISLTAWIPFVPAPIWEKLDARLTPWFFHNWPAARKAIARLEHSLFTLGASLPRLDYSVATKLIREPIRARIRILGARAAGALAIAVAAYVLVWNVSMYRPRAVTVPERLGFLSAMFRLDQHWDMFSRPMFAGGWLVIPAKLHSGASVDLFTGLSSVSERRPALVSSTFKNDRWRKYFVNLEMRSHEIERGSFGRYLCISWNESHPPASSKVEAFRIYWFNEPNVPFFPTFGLTKTVLWQGECFDGAYKKWEKAL